MWIPLVYRDIDPTRYLISDEGKIALINGRILNGCNPKNEKGYIRVTLVNKSGKLKKYALHRLVLAAFTYDSNLEVDHIDCNKLNPALYNLEYVTGDENKHRASINGLYRTGEDHQFSILTNDQVRKVCELFEQGYNIRKVEKKLGLCGIKNIDSILDRIFYRKTWNSISKSYKWDVDEIRMKTYKRKDLLSIASLIQYGVFTSREIAKYFPKYDEKKLIQVIKKMRQGKLYRPILEEVKGSTTIAYEPRDENGFIILVHKH